jgi:hypothetical protein
MPSSAPIARNEARGKRPISRNSVAAARLAALSVAAGRAVLGTSAEGLVGTGTAWDLKPAKYMRCCSHPPTRLDIIEGSPV